MSPATIVQVSKLGEGIYQNIAFFMDCTNTSTGYLDAGIYLGTGNHIEIKTNAKGSGIGDPIYDIYGFSF